jgi:alanine dehydrogenase
MDEHAQGLSVGFPRMHKEPGERRDFLPDLVATVVRTGARVVIEEGIGSGMGLADTDYVSRSARISAASNEEAFAQDVVVTLRCPETEEFAKMRRGATLVSMLHYPTRPARIAALQERGIEGMSLDGIVDDAGRRLVVNAKGVAWNGLEAAFDLLEATWPPLRSAARGPVQVLVIGIGTIGRHAVEAASKFGSDERCRAFLAEDLPGVVVRAVGRTVTDDEGTMRELFSTTDVLVDASQRDDPSRPLVPNHWLAALPSHAVICDLVVDPYLMDAHPPTVRSIEGIPRGDLDRYAFASDHPAWSDTIPAGIATEHRRHVVSCYSWPGVRPHECMELYGAQLGPLLEVLLERGGAVGLRADGPYQERALHRAWLRAWLGEGQASRHGGRGPLVGVEPS